MAAWPPTGGCSRVKGYGEMRGSRVVWLLATCCFMLSCSQQFILGVPDRIAASAGVTLTEVGQLVTVFGLSSALGTPAILVLTSRWTQRSQLVLGLVLMAAGMLVMGSTSSYAALLVARVAMGAGNGTFTSTATAMATKLAEPGHEGSALSNVMLGFSLSQVLAMPMARTLVVYMDWHWFYLALGVPASGAAAALSRLLPGNVAAGASEPARALCPARQPRGGRGHRGHDGHEHGVCRFLHLCDALPRKRFWPRGPCREHRTAGSGAHEHRRLRGQRLGERPLWMHHHHPDCPVDAGRLPAGRGAACDYVPLALAVALCLWVVFDWSFVPAQERLLTRIAGSSAPMAIALSGSGMQLGSALGSAMGGAVIFNAPLAVLPFVAAGCVGCAFVVELFVLRGIRPNRRAVKEVAET